MTYRIVRDPKPGRWPLRWPFIVIKDDHVEEIFTSKRRALKWIERDKAADAEGRQHPRLTARDMPEVWRDDEVPSGLSRVSNPASSERPTDG